MVRDLDRDVAAPFLEAGAKRANKPKAMAIACEIIITCLPSPAASAAVMETEDGVLAGLSAGKIWAEMSTTDAAEVARFGPREWSPNIIKRLEEACNTQILATGFPAEMTDVETEEQGYEVIPKS